MPTQEEWIRIHADLMVQLRMPCKLQFSSEPFVGQHVLEDDGTCHIDINPDADFRVPAHLILHEAAHCRANDFDVYHGHDDDWAKILCSMYTETGTPLPETTSFIAFAKHAGI